MTSSPLDRAAEAFAVELAQWRTDRGLSKKQLATEMGFDPSYVSHVEGKRHRPTEDFAKRAEAVLDAGGAIWLRFTQYDELRRVPRGSTATTPNRDPPVPDQWAPIGAGLVVEQEIATLTLVNGRYRCTVRRYLYNAGPEPVTRYPVRISVDRYPEDPKRSNEYHRENPLTWDELALVAVCGEDPAEPMTWRAVHDRDSLKEIWLLFENEESRFPLYHGERTVIEYTYLTEREKFGEWFARTVRLPTRSMVVRLDFPDALRASVWGVQTSLTAEAPLRTPVTERIEGDRAVFEWTTENPPLHGRYKLDWRFREES